MRQAFVENYSRRSPVERWAICLTLFGAILGLAFATIAPNLSLERRAARSLVDLLVLGGVFAFLTDPSDAQLKKLSLVARLWRIILAGFTVAAIVYTASIPGIDPWLRAYRLSLSVIILATLVSGLPRAMSKRYLRNVFVLEVALMAIQMFVFVFVTWSVDGPIAYAGFAKAMNGVTAQLDGPGISIAGPIARVVPKIGVLVVRENRLYGNDDFHDVVHWANGDVAEAFKAYIDAANERGHLHLIKSLTQTSPHDACRAIQLIDPVLTGYRHYANQAVATENEMNCAIVLGDEAWQRKVYAAAYQWFSRETALLKNEIAAARCNGPDTPDKRIERFYFILEAYAQNRPQEMAYWAKLARAISGRPDEPGVMGFAVRAHRALTACRL